MSARGTVRPKCLIAVIFQVKTDPGTTALPGHPGENGKFLTDDVPEFIIKKIKFTGKTACGGIDEIVLEMPGSGMDFFSDARYLLHTIPSDMGFW